MSLSSVYVRQMSDQYMFNHDLDLTDLNKDFRKSKPSEIMQFTAEYASNPVIFTNFRPLAVAVLHLVTKAIPNIPVVWVDHGFNTAYL